MLKSVTDH